MPYQQVTLATFRGLVRNQLGAAANTFWRDAELNLYINESLRVFNALTGYWRLTGTQLGNGSPALTVADQVWYPLPSTITSGMRVSFNGIPLVPSSLSALDQGRVNWESETTVTGGDVPTKPQLWAIAGLTLIAIWPADHAGGNSLVIDGIMQTPSLVADTDYIDIGQEEFSGLLDYCQHVAVFKEGGAEFEATIPLMQGFLKSAATRNAMISASALFREAMGMDEGRERNPRRSQPERVGAR